MMPQIVNKEYYRKPCEQICYNCTQAVEKYLKGFLLYDDKDINYNREEINIDKTRKKFIGRKKTSLAFHVRRNFPF
jgi:HEPN domain-containing protein